MSQRIAKLEALLARIKANAGAPRPVATTGAMSTMTVPPTADARVVLADEQHDEPSEREVEAPLESRARLVAAPEVEPEPEEIQPDDVLELDDRHIVPDTRDVAFASTVQAQSPFATPAPVDEPPPSSRRPIAEPAETPQEAQIQVAHTPPPESGKQVAADALSFDDDFTGVREAQPAARPAPATPAEPSIQLQSLRMPAVQAPAPIDEMEVQLPSTVEATRPPPGLLPDMRSAREPETPLEGVKAPVMEPEPLVAEVTRPTRPVAAAHVAQMPRDVPIAAPKTFGELVDLALSL